MRPAVLQALAAIVGAPHCLVGPDAVLTDPDELLVYESDGLTMLRATADIIVFPTGRCNPGEIFPTAKSCVRGELAYRPHSLEERGLAQRL